MSSSAHRDSWYAAGHHRAEPIWRSLAAAVERTPHTPLTFCTLNGISRFDTSTVVDRSAGVAANLWARGLRPGDPIVVQVPNSVENSIVCLAAIRLGLVLVPVVHIYGPSELSFILRQTRARAIVIPDQWGSTDFVARFASAERNPELELVIVRGDAPDGTVPWAVLEGTVDADGTVERHPDDTCLIAYTSGSTGEPKGVRHTGNTLRACLETGPPSFSNEPNPVSLFASPSGHIGGVIGSLLPFATGVPGVYIDRWDAERAAQLIEEHRITRSSGAPLHLLELVEQGERGHHDLSSFWYHLCGGAAVPPDTIERATRLGWRPARSFGSTEHPSCTASKDSADLASRSTTDGSPAEGSSVRIVDDDGVDVRVGFDGEVLNIGPKLFDGYTNPRHDVENFTHDGWFRTGDIGRLDEQGRLTITDRKKDIIIRGGENISSSEVESVLVRHPNVVEVAAVSAPDERYGERVCAFVRLSDKTELSLTDVIAWFREQGLAIQKTPELLVPVEEFPRTPTGKVNKAILRAELRAG
jgi:acyl-CoA synthetase